MSLLVIMFIGLASAQVQNLFNGRTRGELTFYGQGADSGGTCNYNNPTASLANQMPTIAVGDFSNAAKCGMCVMIYPLGTGSGNSNFPNRKPFMAFVNNQCPECGPDNLDLAETGDGRWNIEWEAVDCPVSDNILLLLKSGSSIWHTEIQARNFHIPIREIKYNINGQWTSLSRKEYNFFVLPSLVSLPVNVQLISITGETKQLTLTSGDYSKLEPNLISTSLQFSGIKAGGGSTPSNPPSSPPSSSSSCSGVVQATDPSNIWWVELKVPAGASSVSVKCSNGNSFGCTSAWDKYQCPPPTGKDCPSSGRVAIVDGKSCNLAESIGATDIDGTQAEGEAPLFTSPYFYALICACVGIVILVILIVVVVVKTNQLKSIRV